MCFKMAKMYNKNETIIPTLIPKVPDWMVLLRVSTVYP